MKRIILLTLFHLTINAETKIILSAALADTHYETRKEQYIQCLNVLKQYGYKDDKIYIVEALKKQGPTFLDDYCINVFYSQANNAHLRNKGINEGKTLLDAFYHFKFSPEDMIIKMTGRYQFTSDAFLRLVEENADDYDAFFRINFWQPGDAATYCFAMKGKHFQEMYETLDYNYLENAFVSIEVEVGKYIARKVKEGNFKVFYINKFGIFMSRNESTICSCNETMDL